MKWFLLSGPVISLLVQEATQEKALELVGLVMPKLPTDHLMIVEMDAASLEMSRQLGVPELSAVGAVPAWPKVNSG